MSDENEKYKNALNTLVTTVETWKRYKNGNRIGAYSVSIVIIIFGLASSIMGLFNIKGKTELAGVCAAIVVAAQGIEETFKFKSREEKYRNAQKVLESEIVKLKLDPDNIDIQAIKDKFSELDDFGS
jgi:hypothetical protein